MARSVPAAPLIPRWFLLAVVLVLFVPALSFFLNHSIIRNVITQRLKSEIGLEVGDIRIRLLPRLIIAFSDLRIPDVHQSGAAVRIPEGTLTLRYLALLKKQVAIVNLVAVKPQLTIIRDRDGQWQVPSIGGTEPERDPQEEEGGFTIRWLLPDLQVIDGDILVVDEEDRAPPRRLHIRNVNGLLDSHLLRTQAELAVSGEIEGADPVSTVTCTGVVSMTAGLRSHTAPGAARPLVRFEGDVKIRRVDVAPWIAASALASEETRRSWRADMDAHVLVMPGVKGYDAEVPLVEARLDWLVARGFGAIRSLGTEHAAYVATVSAVPVQLDTLLRKIPSAWIPASVGSAVEEHALAGTLELVSATFTGLVDQAAHGQWKGVAKLSKGGGRFGSDRLLIRDLSGTVFFNSVQVEALDLSGALGALNVTNGKMVLSHLELAPALDLQVTGTGTTRDILALVQDLGGAGAGERVLNAITAPKGEVQVSIHVAGPLAPDVQVGLVKADITGRGLGANLPEYHLTADQIDGTVGVTPRFVEFKHVQGRVGPVRFDIQGALEMGAAPRLEQVTVEMTSEAADLLRVLGMHSPPGSGPLFDGASHATVRLSGALSSPRWTGRIDLTELAVMVPPVVKKRRGVISSVEFDGSLVMGKRITAHRLALQLPSGRVEGRAELRLKKRPEFDVNLNMEPLSLTRLADGFAIGPTVDGVLSASLSVAGRGADPTAWTTSGWVELDRGTFAIEGLQDRLREVSGRIRLAGQKAMVERVAFKMGDSDIAMRGVVEQWMTDPAPTILVESSKLDVTRLLPAGGGSEPSDEGLERLKQWAASGHADVTAIVKQAHYHRLQFRTLSARLRVEEGRMELSDVIGKTPDGVLSGRLVARVASHKPMDVEGDLQIDGMPVHQLLSVFHEEQDRLKGMLSLTGSFHASIGGASPVIETIRSREPVALRLSHGRILHGTVLPKVLKILNLPVLLRGKVDFDHDGIPFDLISATINMQDGLWGSQDMVFDSPIMKISGAGTLDMRTDQLDLALAVSPLGAYSDMLGKVPLFGTLLAGDRPGLTTALFEVTGPRQDPDIRYLPIESFAKGLTGYPRLAIDVLTNVITLPQKFIAPSATP